MGIYDRDYYRREGPSFLESLSGRASVCKWLIIINIVVFILQLAAGHGQARLREFDAVSKVFQLDVRAVLHGEVWRLLTYAFLHDGILHILFNMLFLWWFGKDMEELYGPKEFLAFYLVSGVLGGLAFVAGAVAAEGMDPGDRYCIGASGAVTAVMVLCACHYPTQVIYFFMLPVPIWLFVGFQILQDMVGFMGGANERTAYSVHLGGAAFAFAYYKLHWRMLNILPDIKGWQQRRSQPRLRVYRGEDSAEELHMPTPVPVAAAPAGDPDEHLEAKLDAVLEKVAKQGQASLSEGEKQILMRASALYKKRRS